MPPTLRDKISADVRAISADPSVRSRIEAGGQHVQGSTPDEFSAAIERQRSRIREMARIVDLSNSAK
jgi:tripartite-type tricarboxylate transporter receptor subunit TctC